MTREQAQTEQKFHRGDLVRVAKDQGSCRSHFPSDCDAIVLGSHADQYGPEYGGYSRPQYTLHLKGSGQHSWYEEKHLTLIESGRLDKLKEWKDEQESDRRQKADLDWIFAHGPEVVEEMYGASIQTLADGLGVPDLWGSRGEGFVWLSNAIAVLSWASPYLITGNKAGWLAECEQYRKNHG